MLAYMPACMCTCTPACMFVGEHTCLHICVHTCLHVCGRAHMCEHTHMETDLRIILHCSPALFTEVRSSNQTLSWPTSIIPFRLITDRPCMRVLSNTPPVFFLHGKTFNHGAVFPTVFFDISANSNSPVLMPGSQRKA